MRRASLALLLLATSPLAGCHIIMNPDATVRDVRAGAHRPDEEVRAAAPQVTPLATTYRDLQRHTDHAVGEDFDPDIFHDPATGRHEMVYASTRHSTDPEIYIKEVAGKEGWRRITNSPDDDVNPKFSPDGRWIAFTSNRNGNWDIFITSAEVSGPTWQVTDSPRDDVHPTWSPDGHRIAYASRVPGGEWELWIQDIVSGELVNLGLGGYPEWSPLGDRLAFVRPTQRGPFWYAIWTVETNGNKLTQVVASDDSAAINPAWSPDGHWLAYASVHRSKLARLEERLYAGDDIWIVSADGIGPPVRMTDDPASEWGPVWGPRDGRLYFCSERSRARNVWSVVPSPLPERGLILPASIGR